jgi:hypothetical protein
MSSPQLAVTSIVLLCVSALFGASLYDAVVMAPNLRVVCKPGWACAARLGGAPWAERLTCACSGLAQLASLASSRR